MNLFELCRVNRLQTEPEEESLALTKQFHNHHHGTHMSLTGFLVLFILSSLLMLWKPDSVKLVSWYTPLECLCVCVCVCVSERVWVGSSSCVVVVYSGADPWRWGAVLVHGSSLLPAASVLWCCWLMVVCCVIFALLLWVFRYASYFREILMFMYKGDILMSLYW